MPKHKEGVFVPMSLLRNETKIQGAARQLEPAESGGTVATVGEEDVLVIKSKQNCENRKKGMGRLVVAFEKSRLKYFEALEQNMTMAKLWENGDIIKWEGLRQ